MDEGLSRVPVRKMRAEEALRNAALVPWTRDFARVALALGVYGTATALLLQRVPAILGSDWSWLGLLLVPTLTVLMAGLRTGTALAIVLVYAFVSATVMAVQGYLLGWNEVVQAQNILSHFATVFFLASAVALVSLLRSRQAALQQARELVRRYLSRDEVTGLLTPGAFEAAVSRELNRSHRTSRPFLLLSIDVSEYFRPGQGSAAAGIAQKRLGEILSAETRENYDLWTLWKDNLYLGLLIETDALAVRPALRRVLGRVAKTSEFDGAELAARARFGVSSYPRAGVTLEDLLVAVATDLQPLEDLLEKYADARLEEQLVTGGAIEHFEAREKRGSS